MYDYLQPDTISNDCDCVYPAENKPTRVIERNEWVLFFFLEKNGGSMANLYSKKDTQANQRHKKNPKNFKNALQTLTFSATMSIIILNVFHKAKSKKLKR